MPRGLLPRQHQSLEAGAFGNLAILEKECWRFYCGFVGWINFFHLQGGFTRFHVSLEEPQIHFLGVVPT